MAPHSLTRLEPHRPNRQCALLFDSADERSKSKLVVDQHLFDLYWFRKLTLCSQRHSFLRNVASVSDDTYSTTNGLRDCSCSRTVSSLLLYRFRMELSGSNWTHGTFLNWLVVDTSSRSTPNCMGRTYSCSGITTSRTGRYLLHNVKARNSSASFHLRRLARRL